MSGVTRDLGFGVSGQICLTQIKQIYMYKQELEIWNVDIDIHYPSSELLFSVCHIC